MEGKLRIALAGAGFGEKYLVGLSHNPVHHLADMLDVEPSPVECAIGDLARQQLADAAHASLPNGILRFHNDRRCAHAHDHAIPSAIEGQGSSIQALFARP